jgi:DNA-binding NarL/FixJ family response regulator
MADSRVRVVILEDHQGIIDGYMYRLNRAPEIEVVGTAMYGEDLGPLLDRQPGDVLLMDINVPTSSKNHNSFPILHAIPELLNKHPHLHILVISRLNQPALIEALIERGISGYIFKNDQPSIQQLAKIILSTANDGVYFSPGAYPDLSEKGETSGCPTSILTPRQQEILSMCAAYPDLPTAELAFRLGIVGSTLRNLLSNAYFRLEVRTKAAAIARAQQLGLLTDSNLQALQNGE